MAEKDVELNMGPTIGEPFLINSQPVEFRSINADDFAVIKYLHELFFPITYGDAFYEKTCAGIGIAGEKLFSSLAVLNGEVIGFVLGQFMKYPAKCEDKDMFSTDREPKTVFYILTLGLLDQHRRTGLGSKLIRQCEEFACLDWECGAVYLHVITTNTRAINFYKKNQYKELRLIDEFYHFDDKYHAAYLYIRYLNNYKAPLPHRLWSSASYYLTASLSYVTSLFSFFTPSTFSTIFPSDRRISTCPEKSKNSTDTAIIDNNSSSGCKIPNNVECRDGVCFIKDDTMEYSGSSEARFSSNKVGVVDMC